MVRRWSYLNRINRSFYDEHTDLDFVHHEGTFRATTYYRRKFGSITKLSRRSWSRRKHLHNWLVYQNVFTDWARDYLFFRKYNRFIIALHVFKNSYLIYNLLVFKKSTTVDFLGSESMIVSNVIKKVIRYCHRLNPTFSSFFKQYRHVSWLYLTSPYQFEELRKSSILSEEPLYLPYQSLFYSSEINLKRVFWLQIIIDSILNLTLSKVQELYKVAILLILPLTL